MWRSINVRTASDKNHQQKYEPKHPGTDSAKMSRGMGCERTGG